MMVAASLPNGRQESMFHSWSLIIATPPR
jgi:hypothetical protein